MGSDERTSGPKGQQYTPTGSYLGTGSEVESPLCVPERGGERRVRFSLEQGESREIYEMTGWTKDNVMDLLRLDAIRRHVKRALS